MVSKPYPNFPYFPLFAAATGALLDFVEEVIHIAPAAAYLGYVSHRKFKHGDSEGIVLSFLCATSPDFAEKDYNAIRNHEFKGNLFFYVQSVDQEEHDGFHYLLVTLAPMD